MNKHKQNGFHLQIIAIVIVLVGVIGFGAYKVIGSNKSTSTKSTAATSTAATSSTTKSTSVDYANPPKIVQADAVDLSHFYSISKFRSGSGHDFSDGTESCRSMKHYFIPLTTTYYEPASIPKTLDPATSTPEYGPIDGTISQMVDEQYPLGKQIYITSTAYPSITIRLFHVFPLSTIKEGQTVKAGDRIGSLLPDQETDISVTIRSGNKEHYVSYFSVMSDSVFAKYQARGITDRDQLIISKAARDASPLTCSGEQFANSNGDNPDDTVTLSGYVQQKNQ